MPFRVLALLLLAAALLWSGLGTFETSGASAVPSTESRLALDLDDLPAPAQSDPTTETPGLLQAAPEAGLPALALDRGRSFQLNRNRAPFLAGLLRPPCDAGTTA